MGAMTRSPRDGRRFAGGRWCCALTAVVAVACGPGAGHSVKAARPDGDGWWCTIDNGQHVSDCVRDQGACEHNRARLQSRVGTRASFSACAPEPRAHCFAVELRPVRHSADRANTSGWPRCQVTAGFCEGARSLAIQAGEHVSACVAWD